MRKQWWLHSHENPCFCDTCLKTLAQSSLFTTCILWCISMFTAELPYVLHVQKCSTQTCKNQKFWPVINCLNAMKNFWRWLWFSINYLQHMESYCSSNKAFCAPKKFCHYIWFCFVHETRIRLISQISITEVKLI